MYSWVLCGMNLEATLSHGVTMEHEIACTQNQKEKPHREIREAELNLDAIFGVPRLTKS